ncbi:AraC family transcriptional regulator [Streptomyces armeniacus]|uniref:AraC family transcriptional regulator n=1 Tax=Streptomyces armeniacus TaxID=83291 RepID=UPI001FE35BC3|nr:AraC family transcriptional regulator [Streptomyces armeniacus]
MSSGEWARHWQYERLPGLDLLRAHYVRQTFPRHAHDGYVFGAVSAGIQVVGMPYGTERVSAGQVVMINPEVPHTSHAGVPEGWAYATLYADSRTIADIAAETTVLRGTAGFADTVADDARSARLLTEVHRAAEEGNALAADSLFRVAIARLLRGHGGPLPEREISTAGARNAVRARAILEARMSDPPTLEQLAGELGGSPFSLLRAFRERYGMPPHTWLTDARVRRARGLLEAGTPPAEVATAVGFTDQPHLGRHFRRIVGVPPAAYQRERRGTAA